MVDTYGCDNGRTVPTRCAIIDAGLEAEAVHTRRAEYLQQQHAQPVAHLWECQGRRQLLPPMGFPDQEPERDQRQRHVMMPALPGAYLISVHACFTLASLKAGFNTGASLDDPRQFPQRRLLELRLGPTCRREIILVAVAGVLIGGIPRGMGLPRSVRAGRCWV